MRTTSKPVMAMLPTSDISSRLSTFLPQLKEANAALSPNQISKLDEVSDDEEHYIEMNLGLGVLKEVKGQSEGIKTMTDDSSSSDESSESEQDDAVQKAFPQTMSRKPGIEEIDDGR